MDHQDIIGEEKVDPAVYKFVDKYINAAQTPNMDKDIAEPKVDPAVYKFVNNNTDALPYYRATTPNGNPSLTGYHLVQPQ